MKSALDAPTQKKAEDASRQRGLEKSKHGRVKDPRYPEGSLAGDLRIVKVTGRVTIRQKKKREVWAYLTQCERPKPGGKCGNFHTTTQDRLNERGAKACCLECASRGNPEQPKKRPEVDFARLPAPTLANKPDQYRGRINDQRI